MKHLLLSAFAGLLLYVPVAVAGANLVVTCSEPSGPRTDYYAGKFEHSQDGFAGVRPTFIFDDATPKVAIVVFGPSQHAVAIGVKDPGAFEAAVVVKTSEQISLVASTGSHIAQLYTLFPQKGQGFFTLHKHLSLFGGVASTATMFSKCEFKYR